MSNLDFINFINNNNIIETIISTILSFKTQEIVDSIIEYLLMPFVNRDADNDGEADINKIEKIEINFKGVSIKLGKFLVVLIKYFFIIYIVFLFQKYFKK